MAEVAVLIGLVAAAAQFTEIGCSILLHASTLYSRFQSVPQCLRRTLDEIQLLLNLADQVSKKDTVQTLSKDTSTSSESVPAISLSSLSWLESVWKNCTVQAQSLENIIKSMLCETEDSRAQRLWKKILTMRREETIFQILTEIERYKSMLNLWFGQECLENIRLMRQNMLDVHGQQVAHLANEITALKADVRAHLKCEIQVVRDASMIQVEQPHQLIRTDLDQNWLTPRTPLSPRDLGLSSNLVAFCCRCRSMDWKRIIQIGDSKMLVRHGKVMCEDCSVHQHSMFSSETAIRYRKRVDLLHSSVEFAFLLKWKSGFPSLGISLKTEARVPILPLHCFFKKLYETSLYQCNSREPVSKEKQDILFSVARRMLLQAYQSGTASPQDVDREGRTLLHIEFSGPGSEAFLAKMIHLLLSIGFRGDAEDDRFRTVQQALVNNVGPNVWDSYMTMPALNSPINHTLLEWTPYKLPNFMCATQILDCVLRWPESASDLECRQICDIVIRKSIHDLNMYVSKNLHLTERTGNHIAPLHFAAAARWPQGTELLLAHGADRYAQDFDGDYALDIAIKNQCTEVVEILLQGDCMPYFSQKKRYQTSTLPPRFLQYGLYGNQELQNILVKVLARHRHRLGAKRPYHDLAQNFRDGEAIAKKLFAVGFRKLEEYDEQGMTPLIRACHYGNMSMVTFLLKYGADPSANHRDTFLRAGHFIVFEADRPVFLSFYGHKRGDELSPLEEAKVFQTAFNIAERVNSRCRCSLDGYSPAISTFRAGEFGHYFERRQSFEEMLRHLGLSLVDLRQQWRYFVRMELFDRLELTHTCIRRFPMVRVFPEQDRLEIEEEEEELNSELEVFMNGFDDWQDHFDGDILDCVDTFFDKLDQDLRPRGGFMCGPIDGYDIDILAKGTTTEDHWVSSRGEILHRHQEGVQESYILQYLFD